MRSDSAAPPRCRTGRRSALFIEVDDLEAMAKALPPGTELINPRRQTFYGSTETIFRDGAGNIITLAKMA